VECTAKEATTSNARELRSREASRLLAAAVDRCEKLPVLDRALQRVLALAELEETTLGDLVGALEQDPGLAANVLRFANAAANPVRMPVRTVRQAVTRVGRKNVRRLALDSVAYRFFERAEGNGGVSRGHLHLHALQVSRLAVICAERAGIPSDGPHLAGLLHDCGKLVMPVAFGEAAVDAIATVWPAGHPRARAEFDRFGADHAHAGALLAAGSGVDDEIVRAIAWHHGGDSGRDCPDRVTACVQLADQVAAAIGGAELDHELCHVALGVLGLLDILMDELALAAGAPTTGTAPMSELVTRVRELEALATTDDLTGIASRRHWLAHVRAELSAGVAGGIIALDIDAFKTINDTHGHQVGDVVLCQVAQAAATVGFAGRLGGDELAVWVAAGPQSTREVAEQIVRRVRRDGQAGGPPVTVSAGTAATTGGGDLERLLACADQAHYGAKRQGRDRAVDIGYPVAAA
jgi:diguanylate cyclase (GGDEF)-like protein/putative nucleotidyltransferase with HDIG domain